MQENTIDNSVNKRLHSEANGNPRRV